MQESLLGGGRKNGKWPMNCLIPSVVAGVLGVLLVGAVIGLAVMGSTKNDCPGLSSSSPSPISSSSSASPVSSSSASPVSSSSSSPVSSSSASPVQPVIFTEFTAETYYRYCDSRDFHCANGRTTMMYAYGPGKYCTDIIDDKGNNMAHTISTADDKTLVTCQMVGNHGSCLNVTTASNNLVISTAGMDLVAQNQPCNSLYPDLPSLLPNRKLDKCDYYTYSLIPALGSDDDTIIQILVESDTGYPVVEAVKSYASAFSTMIVFSSFTPGKPQDESHLLPYPNVTVVDLRDHEGDCGEEPTFTTKKYEDNVHVRAMLRNAAIQQHLHMPLLQHGFSVSPSLVRNTVSLNDPDIPKEFDARKKWSNCTDVISTIIDQFICQSCWAMSSAAVLGDRMCVANKSKGVLSPQFMVYCGTHSFGCQVGVPTMDIWDQLVTQGTVTDECVPFTARDGPCPAVCRDGTEITDDMFVRAKGVVVPWDEDPEARIRAIQTEIMTNGPVQVHYMLFTDMIQYSGGVYHRTKEATAVGAHAVRMVGWGTTDDGVDYWIVANSWGKQWGEDGFFRIRRGSNECDIENVVLAPIVNDH